MVKFLWCAISVYMTLHEEDAKLQKLYSWISKAFTLISRIKCWRKVIKAYKCKKLYCTVFVEATNPGLYTLLVSGILLQTDLPLEYYEWKLEIFIAATGSNRARTGTALSETNSWLNFANWSVKITLIKLLKTTRRRGWFWYPVVYKTRIVVYLLQCIELNSLLVFRK